jgi:hypothetical protein
MADQVQTYLAPCTQEAAVAEEIIQQAQVAQVLEVMQVITLQVHQQNLILVEVVEVQALTQMALAMAEAVAQE